MPPPSGGRDTSPEGRVLAFEIGGSRAEKMKSKLWENAETKQYTKNFLAADTAM